jgi:hypothetical protein
MTAADVRWAIRHTLDEWLGDDGHRTSWAHRKHFYTWLDAKRAADRCGIAVVVRITRRVKAKCKHCGAVDRPLCCAGDTLP